MANIALITNNILSDSGTALTSVVTGSGTTNYLSKFAGSTALGNSIIYDNGTAVGIGTTSPAYTLDVNGTGRFTGTTNQITAYYDASNYMQLQHNSISVANTALLFNVNSAERMRLLSTGNLLIGTTTDAGYKLDVNGTARINSTLSLTNSTYAGTFSFYLSAANVFQASSSNIGVWLQVGGGNRVYIIGQEFNSTARGNIFGNTVGGEAISATTIIAQSSGTTATTGLSLRYTINNTGTYVGTTRGIYYNPTVTSLTGTTHYAIETVVGDVILGSTSGNVGIGTTTLGTATRLTLGGSQTASSAIARGGLVNTTLVAAANSDVLVGLDITPTFTNGAFTNVSNLAIRTNGNVQVRGNTTQFGAVFQVLDTAGTNNFYIRDIGDAFLKGTLWFGTLNGSTAMSSGYLSVYSGVGTGTSFITFTHNNGNVAFRALSNSVLQLNPSAGNVLIGTTTDAGYKLDVLGTIRANNTAYGQSTVRIETNNAADMCSQIVFMQNSPNWPSYIGTHVSGGGANYGLQFKSQNAINLVMNRDGSNFFGNALVVGSARVHIRGAGSTSSTTPFLVENSSLTELFRVRDNGNVIIGSNVDNGNKLQVTGNITASGGVIASTLGAQNSAEVNVNESSNNLLVYADITGGSNKLYGGGQVKANIYTSSVTTPTVINTGTTVSLMEWYPTTTQGVMIDYVFYIASGNYMRSGTFTAVNDNAGNTQYVDNATPDLNGSTSTVTFAAVDNGGTIEFQVTNASGSPVYMNILTRYIPNIF